MEAMETEGVEIRVAPEENDEEPPPPPPPPPEPTPTAPPTRQPVFDPKRVDPKTTKLDWKAWGVSVKCPDDEKQTLARQVLARLKAGEKEAFAVYADCVIFGCATKEGFFLYDCSAKRRAEVT